MDSYEEDMRYEMQVTVNKQQLTIDALLVALRDLIEHTSNMEAQHPDYHGDEGPNLSPPLSGAVAALALVKQ